MLWKSLSLMYKIFDIRTCGLSHQIKGPTTVKLAKTGFMRKIVKFTITGPLIWCDNPQVRMSKILYINNNNFHHLGRSQMCAGGCYVFRTSKPHSGTLWITIAYILGRHAVLSWQTRWWSLEVSPVAPMSRCMIWVDRWRNCLTWQHQDTLMHVDTWSTLMINL